MKPEPEPAPERLEVDWQGVVMGVAFGVVFWGLFALVLWLLWPL